MSLSRQQFTLLGIFALFFGPLLLVMLMRSSWWQYQPNGLKNRGMLVQPPVQLALNLSESLDRKWLILYELEQPCDQTCVEKVTALRQIHRAAGRNGEHLAIVLLGGISTDSTLQPRLEAIYPEFNLVMDNGHIASDSLEKINADLAAESMQPTDIRTYVLDPSQNVILAYRTDADPADIHKDLKRLLKWSDKEGE